METMDIEIFEVTEVNNDLVAAMGQLVQQLSDSNVPPDFEALEKIVASDATVLLVAADGGVIVGTMTLVLFRIPTGLRAWIEDVVVDEEARGRGIGEALNRAAIVRARSEGARTVDLTSRPSRREANRLYQRMGFTERQTNVYRLAVESESVEESEDPQL
tara:strand:- start:136 stop:615 length:480 start_codon:yes stop_codon:yes gene_type:complete